MPALAVLGFLLAALAAHCGGSPAKASAAAPRVASSLCAVEQEGVQCGPGNGRRTAGGAGTGKVSHDGWPAITGELQIVDDEGRVARGSELNDEILGGHGSDTLVGNAGNDVLWGDQYATNNNAVQHDTMRGGAGRDWIYPSHGTNVIDAGPGADTVRAYYGHGRINCGAGNDTAQVRMNGAYRLTGCEHVVHFCAFGSDSNGVCRQPRATTSAARRPRQNAFLPPAGKVFAGVASGRSVDDFSSRTGSQPAVWEHFITWGGAHQWALRWTAESGARLMLHLSTAQGQNQAGVISPGEIARGKGDDYLVGLAAELAEIGQPVYLRALAEMNNCDLAYSSYDCNGRRRDADHSPARFKQAWKRIYLIMHGGSAAAIDERLHQLGMPALTGGEDTLPEPKVAVMWSPMTGGSPMIAALRPAVYWPGREWVDWIGTSFYSKFPNFQYLEPFYRTFAQGQRLPFAFGEWAMWGGDSAGFPQQLFAWVKSHPRTRMMIYNQGNNPSGPFRLKQFPQAAKVIRKALGSSAFDTGAATG